MGKITGIKRGKTRKKQINVFLDGNLAIGVLPEVVLKKNLKVGQEIGENAFDDLAQTDLRQRCFNTAARFLSYRPRSESEIRQRLLRHGFDAGTIDITLARLIELELVDDDAFARYWVDNRETFSPRSRRMAKLELKRKGLGTDIIEQAVSVLDDKESAYKAAASRARRYAALDYQVFRRRLGQYLARRGFSYGIISEITEKAWQELRKK